LVLKSSLCVEDGAIRACQDQSAKRGRRGKSAKSEAKVKPGRRSRPGRRNRRSRRKANGFSLVAVKVHSSIFYLKMRSIPSKNLISINDLAKWAPRITKKNDLLNGYLERTRRPGGLFCPLIQLKIILVFDWRCLVGLKST
jgi:hypothetical protein